MTEADFSRKYAALLALQRSQIINVARAEEPGIIVTPGAGTTTNVITASCTATDLVGDIVRVQDTGSITRASIHSWQGLPAVGCVLSKATDTSCVVQLSGTVGGYTSLTPGKMHFIGEDGRPIYPRPVPEPGTGIFIQAIGVALNPTTLILNPSMTVFKVFS